MNKIRAPDPILLIYKTARIGVRTYAPSREGYDHLIHHKDGKWNDI